MGRDTRPSLGEADALRIRRLELDLDDLRAENARLRASIDRQQEEIRSLNEAEAALSAELSGFGYFPAANGEAG